MLNSGQCLNVRADNLHIFQVWSFSPPFGIHTVTHRGGLGICGVQRATTGDTGPCRTVLVHAEGMSYSCEPSDCGSASFSPQGLPEAEVIVCVCVCVCVTGTGSYLFIATTIDCMVPAVTAQHLHPQVFALYHFQAVHSPHLHMRIIL